MTALAPQPWLPDNSASFVRSLATATADATGPAVFGELERLVELNRQIHDRDCINLNPATNIMNPRAEAMLSAGLGSRPSLGYPGAKYEMGLEAIEQIEVIAADSPRCSVHGTPRYACHRERSPICTRSWRSASPETPSSLHHPASGATSRTTPVAPPGCID